MNDPELFPPTPEERLAWVRVHLAEELEKREKAVMSATDKLVEARQLLEAFDTALESGNSVAEALSNLRRHAAENGMGVSLKVGNEDPVTLAEVPKRHKGVAS